MRKLLVLSLVMSTFFAFAPLAGAQQGPSRAEMECLETANSSATVLHGEKGLSPSYHHVWVPNLVYGHFQSNGLDLVYEIEGSGNEVVIVVPGGPGLPHEYFHPLLSNLGRYMRLVYFDRRAHFRSAGGAHQMASPEEMADDIDALRKALGLSQVTLLAHSYGGAVALSYAVRYPEQVKRLILVGTSPSIEDHAQAEARLVESLGREDRAAYYSNEGATAASTPCERVRKRFRALYPSYFHKTPNPRTLDTNVYMIYFDALARKMLTADETRTFDVRSSLDTITAPTLVISGRHDLVTPPAHGAEIASGVQRARHVVMEQSGHFPFLEENHLFTEWVRLFIASTPATSDDITPGSGSATRSLASAVEASR